VPGTSLAENEKKAKWPPMNADEDKMLIGVYLRSSAAMDVAYTASVFSRNSAASRR
jgi:hypothetical protein